MDLFSLEATISLDTSEFEARISESAGKVQALSDALDSIDGAGFIEAAAVMEEETLQSLGRIESGVHSLAGSFNQSGAAYAGARATGSAAAQGLIDAYPAYAAALSLYAQKVGPAGGAPSLSAPAGETTSASNADGLSYVPYNDYLSYLHKGEAVLTAAQAQAWRGSRAGGEAAIDYDRLASAVASALSRVTVQMDGETVGNLVTATVDRNIAQGVNRTMRYITMR